MNLYENIKQQHLKQMENMTKEEIYDYLYEIFKKHNIERRCKPRQVYLSYAKGETRNSGLIRKMYLKTQGLTVKSTQDQDKFQERYTKWLNLPIGELYSIEKIREEGMFGQEWRIILNFAVCRGTAEIFTEKTSNDREVNLYRRIEKNACYFLSNPDDLLPIKKCSKCKKTYEINEEYCNICSNKKGINKGKPVKLIEIKSKKDWCNLDKKEFIEKLNRVGNGNNSR